MKLTYDGKRYDTRRCKVIAEQDLHSCSNNYAGTTHLVVASDGQLILWTNSNRQDCHIDDAIEALSVEGAQGWLAETNAKMSEEQEALAVQHGLIEIV